MFSRGNGKSIVIARDVNDKNRSDINALPGTCPIMQELGCFMEQVTLGTPPTPPPAPLKPNAGKKNVSFAVVAQPAPPCAALAPHGESARGAEEPCDPMVTSITMQGARISLPEATLEAARHVAARSLELSFSLLSGIDEGKAKDEDEEDEAKDDEEDEEDEDEEVTPVRAIHTPPFPPSASTYHPSPPQVPSLQSTPPSSPSILDELVFDDAGAVGAIAVNESVFDAPRIGYAQPQAHTPPSWPPLLK